MFVVAGVTGQTGAAVAQLLLEQKKPVRVLVRDAEKGTAWKQRGAEVAVVNLDDSNALAAALEGAEGAYLLVPPAYASADVLGTGRAQVDAYVAALARTRVKRVAMLSSVGAQHPDKTGPIVPCHYAEQQLRRLTDTKVTFLRAAYFVENIPGFAPLIRGQGLLPVLFSPARTIAIVAVEDIARVAVHALSEDTGAHQTLEVSGPKDYSFDEVAAVLSSVIGAPVKAMQVPENEIVEKLTSFGMPKPTAVLYREMALGVEAGLVAFERGAVRQVRGSITLEAALRRYFA